MRTLSAYLFLSATPRYYRMNTDTYRGSCLTAATSDSTVRKVKSWLSRLKGSKRFACVT
jgi:hypothetical protein